MAEIAKYLGPNAVFDHMSVISAQAGIKAQDLHSDVGRARRHLEVHVPLADVTESMGPTLFCPASHGLAEMAGASNRTAAGYALEWFYLTPGKKCTEISTLSYA